MHALAPTSEYWPTGHTAAVGETAPAAHAYPALQLPLHDAVDNALTPP